MTAELSFRTTSPDETRRFGRALGESLASGSFVGLEGPLGSGKTVVVQGAAEGLGYEGYVTSPTFVIVNEYAGRLRVLHVDLYRISDSREIEDIGYREVFFSDGVALVEWSDRAPDLLPPDRLSVTIAIDGREERSIVVRAFGARAKEDLQKLAKAWGGRAG